LIEEHFAKQESVEKYSIESLSIPVFLFAHCDEVCHVWPRDRSAIIAEVYLARHQATAEAESETDQLLKHWAASYQHESGHEVLVWYVEAGEPAKTLYQASGLLCKMGGTFPVNAVRKPGAWRLSILIPALFA
jgi:hypothetical protein